MYQRWYYEKARKHGLQSDVWPTIGPETKFLLSLIMHLGLIFMSDCMLVFFMSKTAYFEHIIYD